MVLSNLCKYLLHNLLVIFGGKLCHIFEIANGITGRSRIRHFYVFGKMINELTSPLFVFVDNVSYMIDSKAESVLCLHAKPHYTVLSIFLSLLTQLRLNIDYRL